jgi:uncharacterized membrane protein YhaH (DUF805 family)
VVTGLSGFYMLEYMDAWDRYTVAGYWWLHLMTLVWFLFTMVLFVLEPLVLHRWFHERATADGDRAFRIVQAMHVVLLVLSLVAVLGGVAGAHGYRFGSP